MPKVQIKHRYTGAVLFEREVPDSVQESSRIRVAVEAAVADDANLGGAYLGGAYLGGAYLSGANLCGANLSGANLSGANLGGAYLCGAYLSGANLCGANLCGANLGGANLSGANLGGAYLGGAYLSGAYLSGANLCGANLGGAYLCGAYLSGANLCGAYLSGARWRHLTINRAPLFVGGLRWDVFILDEHMQIGCELHGLAEWRAFDDARIVQMDGKEALRFWRAHKDALLAMAASDGRVTSLMEVAA